MRPLANHDPRAARQHTTREDFTPDRQGRFTFSITFDVLHMVRIVNHDHMRMVPGNLAFERRGDAPTCLVVDIIPLDVLVADERPRLNDLLAVPLGLHQPACTPGVS